MKVRLFSVVSLVASLALLLSPVGGVSSTVAEGQPVSVETPAPAPDHAQVTAALQGAPVMFVENVSQFNPSTGSRQGDGTRLQVRGTDASGLIGPYVDNRMRQAVFETIYLDMFELGNDGAVGPVSSTSALSTGEYFLATVSGTWSAWRASQWSSVCKGVPEDWPQVPSPGTTNGKVGLDPAFYFAAPVGASYCNRPESPPTPVWLVGDSLQVSLNNGASWFSAVPIDPSYNPAHVYTYILEGQGAPAQFRWVDNPTHDNYGVLTIEIEGPVPTYSISGHIRDGSGSPISGVTVSVSAGGSATTDANGAYTIDGLTAGTYTLTPSKSGYTFSPPTRTVSVPPDATGQDFTGSSSEPPPCDLSKQPVLLVHGWGGPDDLDQDEMGFKQLYQWMQADGYVEGCNLFYATDVKASNDRILNATAIQRNLREAYDTIKALNPGWNGHFDIIGHSYGGLNSRTYLESYTYLLDQREIDIHVDNLFTLGSPHGGAIVPVELFPGAIVIGLGHLNDEEWLSANDLLAGKMNQYNLSHRQPGGVCYRLIGGDFMQQSDLWWKSPVIWALYEIWTDIPNDIGVSRRSSLQLGTNPDLASRYEHVVTYANTDMHGYKDMLGLGAIRSYVNPALTYNEIISPNLGASMDRCHSSQVNTRSAVDAQSEELTIPPLLIASDDITGGQTTTGTVPVDWDGQTAFYVTWMSSGDLDLTLRDPAGAVFTPTVAISDPNADYGKLIFSTSGLATYIFTNTLTGAWTYTLTAASGPYPIPFDLYVNPDSPLVARASVPEWQPFGAPAVITASLFYSTTPVSGATVQAHVTHPDGGEGSISLRDDGLPPDNNTAGDGIYSGTYTDTTTGGFYYVLVEADGTYASQTYHRTAQTVFPVAADSATLSGTYADQPNDENGDGLYEYLDVNVGVNATQQGDFTVAAVLQGEGGQYIDLANTTVYSFTGTTTLTLRFDGQAIRASGLDGPYTITQVLLLDDAQLLKLDAADNAWITAAYDYRQFGSGVRIYLPLILRNR